MAETANMTTYRGSKPKKAKKKKRKFKKATSHARDYTVKSPASY
jgi:hypothetical protein